jgi:hypothetical protein
MVNPIDKKVHLPVAGEPANHFMLKLQSTIIPEQSEELNIFARSRVSRTQALAQRCCKRAMY